MTDTQSGLISLDDKEPVSPEGTNTGLISLEEKASPLDSATAARRAKDTHKGLGEKSPGLDVLQNSYGNGTDKYLRQQHAVEETLKKRQERISAVEAIAQRNGGKISPEDMEKIRTIGTASDDTDPDTIFEKKIGEGAVNIVTGVAKSIGSIIGTALKLNPEETVSNLEVSKDIITNKKIAQNLKEEADQRRKEQSLGGDASDILETFIPGLSWRRLSTAVKNSPVGLAFPGRTMEEHVAYLHTLPPERFKKEAYEAYDKLAEGSLMEAQKFAHALELYTTSDAMLDTAFEALNFIPPVNPARVTAVVKGALAAKAAREVLGEGAKAASGALKQSLTQRMKEVVKNVTRAAVKGDEIDEARILKEAGYIPEGATKAASRILAEGDPNNSRGFMGARTPSIFNPGSIDNGAQALGREMTERIVERLAVQGSKIQDAVMGGVQGERATKTAEQVGSEIAIRSIREDYRHVGDAILDMKPEVNRLKGPNVTETSLFIGKMDGSLFDSPTQAVLTGKDFYKMLDGDLKPVEIGDNKWALKVSRAHDETTDEFRKAMLLDTENKTPVGRGWGPMGWMRSADDLISHFQNKQRSVAQHGMQRIIGVAQEIANNIGDLSNDSKRALKNVFHANKTYKHLEEDGTMTLGRFHTNIQEFEEEFRLLNGRPPNAKETLGYFSYTQLNDMDWQVRNFSIYRDKARQGILNVGLDIVQEGTPGRVNLEGKIVKELPKDIGADAGVFLHTNISPGNIGDYRRLNQFEASDRETIELMLKGGYRIVQVANPSAKPLAGVTGIERPIHFIITKDARTGALPWQQIPYRPGGHKEYAVEHFVKQPKISRLKEVEPRVTTGPYQWDEKEFNGYKIQIGPTGKTRKDGSPVHATTRHETKTIMIDKDALEASWKDKPWRKSKVEGVAALDDSMFPTPESWSRFVLEHEKAHVKFPNNMGEFSAADYENMINRKAQDAYRKPVTRVQTTPVTSDRSVPKGLKPTAGWKLHLNTQADETLNKEIADFLNESKTKFKIGKNSGQSGKDITIYVGHRDNANEIAEAIEKKFGARLADIAGDAKVDDAAFTRKVAGRFDADGDAKFHQYGREGTPVLKDWIDLTQPGFSDEAMDVSRKELERKYGEFYTGAKAKTSPDELGPRVTNSHIYEGETAVMGFHTEAEARKYAQRMDQARLLLKAGDEKALATYLDANLPFTVGEFKALFTRTEGAGIAAKNTAQKAFYAEARLHIDDPIVYLSGGRRFSEDYADLAKGYENFEDTIRSPYNLYDNIDKEYAGQRNPDLYTIREGKGTDADPLYRIDNAEQLDPFATMTRAMTNVMRNRYMDDYKIQAVESFVAEFGDLIKGNRSLAEIKNNPEWYIHNPAWDNSVPDSLRLADAKAAHRSLINFLGTMSPVKSQIETLIQKLASDVYERMGQKWGQKPSDWVAGLSGEVNPFTYMRKFAFHTKLGLFNWQQYFLQSQTMAHVVAIAGMKNGGMGVAGGTMMNALRFTENPKIMEAMAEKAAAFGWKKDEFLESYSALKRTGWDKVQGETAFYDDALDPKLFKGVGGVILDKGTIFFREGEKQVRLAAWNAAYLEWKQANPGKALGNRETQEVLKRADLLSVNMTRASNAAWNEGWASVPTQFLSYQARLMEQFIGGRLTPQEKLRAFMTYSTMYGIPGGLNAAAGVIPWYEDIRKEALERGIDVNDTMVMALHQGIVSTMWNMITGQDLNYAQRFGPGGFSIIKDILSGDKAPLELFLGPSGSIINDTLKNTYPVIYGLTSPFRSDDTKYVPTTNDVMTALSSISSVNNAMKMTMALNTGLWMSKNGTVLKGDMSAFDTFMAGLTGTQPMEVSDAFLMTKSMKDQQKLQDDMQKRINVNYKRAIQAYSQNDPGTGDSNMAQVRMWLIAGGFRPDQYGSVLKRALSGNEELASKIRSDFFIKKAPADQAQERLDAFMREKN